MDVPIKVLADDCHRRDAIGLHDRSILVEAGAGSGKTAVMAGRIAVMLAEGIAPKIHRRRHLHRTRRQRACHARSRVRRRPRGRRIPPELRVALARMVCPTISMRQSRRSERRDRRNHLFDHPRLLPAPDQALSGRGRHRSGRGVMDRNQADLAFLEIVDAWLRERLSGETGGLIAEMVLQDPGEDRGAHPQDRSRICAAGGTLSGPPVAQLPAT